MNASPTGVVKPKTIFIEFKLLRSRELENEPTKVGTSVSIKYIHIGNSYLLRLQNGIIRYFKGVLQLYFKIRS